MKSRHQQAEWPRAHADKKTGMYRFIHIMLTSSPYSGTATVCGGQEQGVTAPVDAECTMWQPGGHAVRAVGPRAHRGLLLMHEKW